MSITIEIKNCSECPDFHIGMIGCDDYCTYPSAPYGEYTSENDIPGWCPRIKVQFPVRPKNPIVVIVNGYPRSGKSTFCDIASDTYDVIDYSTVDTVKSIASDMGWNGQKNNNTRDMLSALKDFYTKWFDGPFNEITKIIEDEVINRDDWFFDFIFVHVREPKEIERIQDFCNENSVENYAVLINRKEVMGLDQNNHADKNVEKYRYDVHLNNNGNLDNFTKNTNEFLASMVDGSLKKVMKMI